MSDRPLLPVCLLMAAMLLSSAHTAHAVNTYLGFSVLKTLTLPVPSSGFMALANDEDGSSNFPLGLYVSISGGQYDSPAPDDYIYRLVPDTEPTFQYFLTFPHVDTDPQDLEFGPGGAFGSDLYVSANNYDNGVPNDNGGAILRVNAAGGISEFFPNQPLISEPGSLAFAPPASIGFPPDLYVSNATDTPWNLFTIDSNHNAGPYTLSTPAEGIAFGPGGAFGTGLYFGGIDGTISVADASGHVTPFASGLGGKVLRLKFSTAGPSSAFAGFLYALVLETGTVYRIGPSGTTQLLLDGLGVSDIAWNDIEVGDGEQRMWVTDAVNQKLYVIGKPPLAVEESQKRFSLGPVHPNPSRELQAEVNVTLSDQGPASLDVFDLTGRLVEHHNLAQLGSGEHRVRLGGTAPVHSGIYWIRLVQGSVARLTQAVVLD